MIISKVIALLMIVIGVYGDDYPSGGPHDIYCKKYSPQHTNGHCSHGAYYPNECTGLRLCHRIEGSECNLYLKCAKHLQCCENKCLDCGVNNTLCLSKCHYGKRSKTPYQLFNQEQQTKQQLRTEQQRTEQQLQQQFKQLIQNFFTIAEKSPELSEPESNEIDIYQH